MDELLPFLQMWNMEYGVVGNQLGSLTKRVLVGRDPVRDGASSADASEKDWVRVRSAILKALEKYPDAWEAVVQALVELRAIDEGEVR